MTDIVERLLAAVDQYDIYGIHGPLETEAADEIRRLREMVTKLRREIERLQATIKEQDLARIREAECRVLPTLQSLR